VAGKPAEQAADDAVDARHDRPDDLSRLPRESPAEAALPWLLRRLDLLLHDARQIRLAAVAARVRPRDLPSDAPKSA
jgi:hypothetical protein